MKNKKFTSVGRPLDMGNPSDIAILIISLSVFLISFVYLLIVNKDLTNSLVTGLGVSVNVFFAWALCRELDPDHKSSAFIAAGIALIASFAYFPPDYAGIVWLILILRLLTRSTGLHPTYFDSIVATILTGYLMYRGDWQYGLFAIIALGLDSVLLPVYRGQLYFASVIAVFLTIILIFRHYPVYHSVSLHLVMTALIIGVIYVPFIISSKKILSLSDITFKPLRPARIQSAQVFSLVLGILFLITQGSEGFQKHIILWSVILASGLYFYFRMLKTSGKPRQ